MSNLIASTFNNLFGSNVTHIANAYPRDIWVLFHSSQISIDFSVKLSKDGPSVSLDSKDNGSITQKQRVKTRTVYKYLRTLSEEYLSVFTYETNGDKRIICENKKVIANRSFIITNDGYIVDQKYGDNVWVEHNGTRH